MRGKVFFIQQKIGKKEKKNQRRRGVPVSLGKKHLGRGKRGLSFDEKGKVVIFKRRRGGGQTRRTSELDLLRPGERTAIITPLLTVGKD